MPPMHAVTPTEVLLVPTMHLDAGTTDAVVERARAHLQRWRPDLIAVEALPGELVVQYEQRGGEFADFSVGLAPAARRGAALLSAGPDAAWAARARALEATTGPAEKVLAWLAAREPLNALLLPYRDLGLPAQIVEFLDDLDSDPSECVRVGARLGRALGHALLAHIDDHIGAENLAPLPTDHDAIWAAQARRLSPLLDELGDREATDDLWAEWLRNATTEMRQRREEVESSAWVEGVGEIPQLHRIILANWRARNLAMAARLRAATATVPGGRVALIVGAAHEGPLRTALSHGQHDVRLVELGDLADAR